MEKDIETGYDCDFIDGPPKELQWKCSICLLTLRQPYQVSCCGYRFCKACLDGATAMSTRCPLCKEEFTSMNDKQLERELSQRKVYCTHRKSGCEWTGELSKLDSHLNNPSASGKDASRCTLGPNLNNTAGPPSFDTTDSLLEGCQLVKLSCCNQDCLVVVLRSQMKAHLDSCPNKPICCKYCKSFMASPKEVEENHYSKCPKVPISCPNECGAELQREDVDKHIEATCRLSKMQCKYKHVGCSHVLLREEMESHMKSESGLAAHLSLMEEALKNLSQQVRRLEQEKAYHVRVVQQLNEQLSRRESSEASSVSLGAAAGIGAIAGVAGVGLGLLGAALLRPSSTSDDEDTP